MSRWCIMNREGRGRFRMWRNLTFVSVNDNTTNIFKWDDQSVGQHHALLPTDDEALLQMLIICVLPRWEKEDGMGSAATCILNEH